MTFRFYKKYIKTLSAYGPLQQIIVLIIYNTNHKNSIWALRQYFQKKMPLQFHKSKLNAR